MAMTGFGDTRDLAKKCRDQAGLIRLMDRLSSPKETHEATAMMLDEAADEIQRLLGLYIDAVNGRREFRQAFREERARNKAAET